MITGIYLKCERNLSWAKYKTRQGVLHPFQKEQAIANPLPCRRIKYLIFWEWEGKSFRIYSQGKSLALLLLTEQISTKYFLVFYILKFQEGILAKRAIVFLR